MPKVSFYKNCIIGAGMSGITAANHLPDSVILEASNRIGGRVRTEYFEGYPLDFGAAWTHSPETNLLREELALRRIPTSYDDESIIMIQNGKKIDEKEYEAFYESCCERIYHGVASSEDASVEDLLRPYMPADIRFSEFLENQFGMADSGVRIKDTSATDYSEIASRASGLLHPEGLSQLLFSMATPLIERQQIKFNQPVREIHWQNKPVKLVTDKGEVIYTDKVIITVSVGVLKSGLIKFFPELPEWKRDALDSIDMCNMNKIILSMERGFFEDNKIEPNTHLHFLNDGEEPLFSVARPNGYPLLVAFVSGETSTKLEKAGDKAAVKHVLQYLEKAYGEGTASKINNGTITSWVNDPTSFGAYSVIKPGYPMAGKILFMPCGANGQLLFAGEACPSTFSTHVAGAYMTGKVAAEAAQSRMPERTILKELLKQRPELFHHMEMRRITKGFKHIGEEYLFSRLCHNQPDRKPDWRNLIGNSAGKNLAR